MKCPHCNEIINSSTSLKKVQVEGSPKWYQFRVYETSKQNICCPHCNKAVKLETESFYIFLLIAIIVLVTSLLNHYIGNLLLRVIISVAVLAGIAFGASKVASFSKLKKL